jgi:hypothetical protein
MKGRGTRREGNDDEENKNGGELRGGGIECDVGSNDAIVVWAPGKLFLVCNLFLSTN